MHFVRTDTQPNRAKRFPTSRTLPGIKTSLRGAVQAMVHDPSRFAVCFLVHSDLRPLSWYVAEFCRLAAVNMDQDPE